MKKWLLTFALLLCAAPAAFAGGVHAKIVGLTADGTKYRVQMIAFDPNEKLEPWGTAEGVVDDKSMTTLLRVHPTSEPGVYEIDRNWSKDGRWVVRLYVGHPGAPMTIAKLGADGRVLQNKLTDSRDEGAVVQRMLHRKPSSGGDC